MRILLPVCLILLSACAVDHPLLQAVEQDAGGLPDMGVDGERFDAPHLDQGVDTHDMPDTGAPGDMRVDTNDVGADQGVDVGPDPCAAGSFCSDGRLMDCSSGTPVPHTCSARCETGDGLAFCVDFNPSNTNVRAYRASPDRTYAGQEWNTDQCATLPGYQVVENNICVLSFGTVAFEGSHSVTGSNALLILSSGALTITGDFRADGNGRTPGPGGNAGGGRWDADDAEGGSRAGRRGSATGMYTDGGGGGGGGGHPGGRGGAVGPDGDPQRAGRVAGGAGQGMTYLLDPLDIGGGGGGGAARGYGGVAGGGGGVLQFSARGTLTLSGTINVSGGGGGQGRVHDNPSINWGGGGGGGGGSLLLESGTELILTGGRVLAAGGGGGGSGSCENDGENGHEEESDPTVAGGEGSEEECDGWVWATDGGAGGISEMGATGEDHPQLTASAGGGGGGAGLVVLRAPVMTTLAGSGMRRFERAIFERVPDLGPSS